MKAMPALKYIMAKYEEEQEQIYYNHYTADMLLLIAQPTRKHPEALPRYTRLYKADNDTVKAPDKTGEEILMELLNG